MPSKKDRRAYYKAYREERKKHSQRVVVRLTPEEYEFFEQKAKQRNISVKALMEESTRESLSTPPVDYPSLIDDIRELKGFVKPIADTINRIAHETNKNHFLKDENELLLEIQKLEGTVKGFIQYKMNDQR